MQSTYFLFNKKIKQAKRKFSIKKRKGDNIKFFCLPFLSRQVYYLILRQITPPLLGGVIVQSRTIVKFSS